MSALYQHQTDGGIWLREHPKGVLGDTPGLGKTRTLIHGLQQAGARRPLIVCPAIVRTHWTREFDAMGWNGVDVPLVASYDAITRGGNSLMAALLRSGVDALVLDEVHYLKHGTSKRTIQLLGKDGYARRLPIVWGASGTPMPRNPAEIWPALSTLRPDLPLRYGVRTYAEFVHRYCLVRGSMVRGQWREKIIGVKPENLHELREMLAEFMLRRDLNDVGLDVPRIDWQVMRLDGGDLTLADVPEVMTNGAIPLDTLADIADDPYVARMRRRLGELKAPLVVEMLKSQLEADPTMRVAVFAHHRSVLHTLDEGLKDFSTSYVDGDTTIRQRDEEIAEFQLGGTRVFIGQNVACAEGMDGLQHATNRAVLVEPDWSADRNYQLGKRVARIGAAYSGRAIVQMVALAGTLDEAIVAQNKRETEMVAAVYDRKEAA